MDTLTEKAATAEAEADAVVTEARDDMGALHWTHTQQRAYERFLKTFTRASKFYALAEASSMGIYGEFKPHAHFWDVPAYRRSVHGFVHSDVAIDETR